MAGFELLCVPSLLQSNLQLMDLVIDRGNTAVKVALFEETVPVRVERVPHSELNRFLRDWVSEYSPSRAILGSVAGLDDASTEQWLGSRLALCVLRPDTPLPLQNRYETPATLGQDRLANAVAAWTAQPGVAHLVVDAGTCLKFDLVNAQGEYLGGAISPGLQMRFKALHTFTEKLPLIEARNPGLLVGQNTETSILSGVVNGMCAEIEGIAEQYRLRFEDIRLWLTGGDSDFFAKALKNAIFADRFLTLKGLHAILRHQG